MPRDYLLRRSNRKTLSLQITRELQVLVRAPLRLPAKEIDAFVARNAGWIAAHLEKERQRLLAHPELSAEEIERLKQRAREHIPKRVALFAKIMGLFPAAVKITSAKTRFGSCSGKNSLCFSCRLMQYPPEAVDYVVVHELAHIVHKNHGAAFYGLVSSVLPDYRARWALLKK